MSMTPITLSPISLTAGSAIQVSVTALYASSVMVQGDSSNTNNIYLGASNVTSTNGISIGTSACQPLTYDLVYGANTKIDLSTLYLASDTTGNKARVTYIKWDGP